MPNVSVYRKKICIILIGDIETLIPRATPGILNCKRRGANSLNTSRNAFRMNPSSAANPLMSCFKAHKNG